MAQQVTGRVILTPSQYDTYDHWRSFALSHGIDFDGWYGNQCWDLPALLWWQYGMYLVTTNNKKKNGCIINTLTQITSENPIISISINKNNLSTHFFKNGSVHSYIYSSLEDRLIEINSSSLPVGIIDYVYSSSFSYKLRHDDYIIMFSDGIKENIDAMEGFFKQVKDYNPPLIAREIAMRFRNDKDSDDISVIVIKVAK